MTTAAATASANTKHKLSERGDDLYQTPPEAVEALLKVEQLPETIWEPACGPGSIVRVLRSHGHVVYATDLIDYNSPDQDMARWDFLMETQLPIGVQAIVTNPQFKLAAQFAAHALKLAPKVIMLLRLNFLEAGNENTRNGRARLDCLDGGRLARGYLFRSRLPMMHREGWEGKKSTSFIPFAWFVWEDVKGPTILNRIDWK